VNSAILGLYGVYLLLIAFRGNARAFLTDMSTESQFIYWLVAILGLGMLAKFEATRDIVGPFIVLAVVATVIRNGDTIARNMENVYKYTGAK